VYQNTPSIALVLGSLWALASPHLVSLQLLPKELIPQATIELDGFLESSLCGGNMGGAGVVSSQFLKGFGFGA
jgi:hypothetical protein